MNKLNVHYGRKLKVLKLEERILSRALSKTEKHLAKGRETYASN